MPVTLKRKAKRCEHLKEDGTQCSGYVVTKDGVQKLLDEGISLVADPAGRLCAFHSRTVEERYEMSVRGGSYSPKRAKAERQQQEEARDPMPRQFAAAAYQLISTLIEAKLPTFPPEPDSRKVALGVYLATVVYDPPYDRGTFVAKILPRGVYMREDAVEDELRAILEELDPDKRELAWEMLANA